MNLALLCRRSLSPPRRAWDSSRDTAVEWGPGAPHRILCAASTGRTRLKGERTSWGGQGTRAAQNPGLAQEGRAESWWAVSKNQERLPG